MTQNNWLRKRKKKGKIKRLILAATAQCFDQLPTVKVYIRILQPMFCTEENRLSRAHIALPIPKTMVNDTFNKVFSYV